MRYLQNRVTTIVIFFLFTYFTTTMHAICTPSTRLRNTSFLNMNTEKLSVAIVGSGAVGCYYGARLWETKEYNVVFHMRGDHFRVSKEKGLNVTSVEGDIYIPPSELLAYEDTNDIGKVDWVIVCIKSTGIQAISSLLSPMLDANTRVLAIMNGLVDEDIVRGLENLKPGEDLMLSKCAAVFGGMAFICSNREGPGRVHHSYAGKLTASICISSEQCNDNDSHEKAIVDLWKPAKGFEFTYDSNLTRARWSKALWNLPFNGLSVAMNGITVDKIVNDPGLRKLAYLIMDETIAVANKDLISRGYSETVLLGEKEKEAMMKLSDNMGPYKTSTMIDLTNRNPMEVQYVFRKAVDRAETLNVPVPTLNTIVTQIEALQRFHNLC